MSLLDRFEIHEVRPSADGRRLEVRVTYTSRTYPPNMGMLFHSGERWQRDKVEFWIHLRSPENNTGLSQNQAAIRREARKRVDDLIAEMARELG